MILTGVLYCRQVDSSWMHIWIEPSPVMQTTSSSGCAIFTPIAAGRPKPMVPRPPALIQRRGPHLMLADVRTDERVAVGQLPELLDHILRLDDLALAVVLEAIFRAPA